MTLQLIAVVALLWGVFVSGLTTSFVYSDNSLHAVVQQSQSSSSSVYRTASTPFIKEAIESKDRAELSLSKLAKIHNASSSLAYFDINNGSSTAVDSSSYAPQLLGGEAVRPIITRKVVAATTVLAKSTPAVTKSTVATKTLPNSAESMPVEISNNGAPISFVPDTTYAISDIAPHNTSSDCYIIISGKVYSVGPYLALHPGGQSVILDQCGKDATAAFSTRGGTGVHSSGANVILSVYIIGTTGIATVDSASTNSFTLTTSTIGEGMISSSPSGITCGTTCSAPFLENSQVVLTATPSSGYTFIGWYGGCVDTGVCTLTMDKAKTVSAVFGIVLDTALVPIQATTGVPPSQTTSTTTVTTPPPAPVGSFTLSTSVTGSGTITSSPSGISCGATCSSSFTNNTQVTLSASPSSGYTFSGWTGACSGTGVCSVTMTQARTVAGTFTVAVSTPAYQATPGVVPPSVLALYPSATLRAQDIGDNGSQEIEVNTTTNGCRHIKVNSGGSITSNTSC